MIDLKYDLQRYLYSFYDDYELPEVDFYVLKSYIELVLCGLVVLFLTLLGLFRFYRSLMNRVRKYQLDYLKHFELLNEHEFNRFLKSKSQKSFLQKRNVSSKANLKAKDTKDEDESDEDDDLESFTTQSSCTLLSLDQSTLDDFRTILKGNMVRPGFDLESLFTFKNDGQNKTKKGTARVDVLVKLRNKKNIINTERSGFQCRKCT